MKTVFSMVEKKKAFSCILALFLIIAAYFILPAKSACAADLGPPIAATPCDTLYYESLSARAWLEAQREITQNQNIILKPDSVLEYTCFDGFLRELAAHAENMLSETNSFGGPVADMGGALDAVVSSALQSYLNANFGHGSPEYDLLGGHALGAGIRHEPVSANSGGAYNCNIMDRVWRAAKCMDFISHLTLPPSAGPHYPTDGFFTFQEYADVTQAFNIVDKRHRPTMCPAGATAALKTKWNANLIAAYITPPYTEDPVTTYLVNMAAPTTCAGTPCLCNVAPIPTGITVSRPQVNPLSYEDHICVQPGCRYNPPAGDIDGNGAVDGTGCYAR